MREERPADVTSRPSDRPGRFPFSPGRRVRKHADYQRIQSQGSRALRATSPHFVFLVGCSPEGPDAGSRPVRPSRLGVVVTKKIGNAVARNRVKRLCRECFRLWPGFVAPGIDLVVIARQGAPLLGLAEVREEWGRAQGALRHRVREALAQGAAKPHVAPVRPHPPTTKPDAPV